MNPFTMFISGGILGILARVLDIFTQNLGNIFSELSVWILIGVLISIYSASKKKAMMNIFPFCIGMIIAYYLTAKITNGVYSMNFIIGWIIFSMCSPVLAYFTWSTKEKGVWPRIISLGILAVTVLASVILFDGPRIHDIIILILLIYFLFIKDVRRVL